MTLFAFLGALLKLLGNPVLVSALASLISKMMRLSGHA
jgi:hypothetical protein